MSEISVFYDLETSEQNFIGQILNFSFIAVDGNFQIVDEFSDNIKISRLQLPSPPAILANRINVEEHQKNSQLSEKAAALKIFQFINKLINENSEVILTGFNSSRFDLPYLRTTLIRNGLNPYFYGKLIYRDLLQLSRKLSVSIKGFPRVDSKNNNRISLSLETLAGYFGLLKGKQAHNSREDVLLTIEMAKYFKKEFSADIRKFEAYEASTLHNPANKGKVYNQFLPEYDIGAAGYYHKIPVALLDYSHRYALWIDLQRFADGQGRKSISWYSMQTSAFFTDKVENNNPDYTEAALRAFNQFRTINLNNFFTTSKCDIEQDIYRIDMKMLDYLTGAIWGSNAVKQKLSKDAKVLLFRNELANYEWGGENDKKTEDLLRKYAIHRYGGDMIMNKFSHTDDNDEVIEKRHERLSDLISQAKDPLNNSNTEDQALMKSLLSYYRNSDISRLCPELVR